MNNDWREEDLLPEHGEHVRCDQLHLKAGTNMFTTHQAREPIAPILEYD